MEYVEGEDLRTIIDCVSPLPINIAALIILEIARGLEYTHNQNIIHRDIKPSNILISKEGNVKLIDFGVAKDDSNTQLTMTGLIVGTPSYMSPEQAHGDPLGPQSDLYALGILLYEMLTGIKPFYGANNTEILARVVRSKYTPPHRINPEINLRLRRIIKKLLKKDKKRRYHNAAALIHDIEKCVPWQIRSHKKPMLAQFLKNLDKTTTTQSNDTIKAALMERSSSWSWNALKYSIAASVLISGFVIFKQFSKKELGYIKVENPVSEMELFIDNAKQIPLKSSAKIFGPFIRGAHLIEAGDRISNATFISRSFVNPNDTTYVQIVLDQKHGETSLRINAKPVNANIYLNGVLYDSLGIKPSYLEPGEYNIEISLNGYQPYITKQFLRSAESYVMHYSLSQKEN